MAMKKNNLSMKTKNIYILLLLLVAAVFTSCEKDSDNDSGEAYFLFKDAAELISPTGYSVDYKGNTSGQQFIVRSNKSWKIIEESENDWARFFPNEGDEDGIVKVIVQENKTFVDRVMHFTFVVDGEDQPVMFTVNQAKATPFLTLSDNKGTVISKLHIIQVAQSVSVTVKANVAYTYTPDVSWITFEKSTPGTSSTELSFAVAANESKNTRTGKISFTCTTQPQLNTTLTIEQEGSEGQVVLFEDFSWLTYGNTILYNSTDPVRCDSWTAEQKAKGWTSTPNTFSSNQPLLYGCFGFAKVGKTSYGGDLISPKLSEIVGIKNIVVTFKAAPYMTATGTKDDNILNVSVIGPGTVSQSQFIIDNWPDYTADPNSIAIWQDPAAERTFTITGATSETQIKFLGYDYKLSGVGAGKNRLFFDDIKVLIPNK